MKGLKSIAVTVIGILLIFSSCQSDVLIDPIDMKVIANNGGFDGYYVLNGGDVASFFGGPLSGGFSTYEKTFKNLNTIEIGATSRQGATALRIQLYKDQILVKEVLQENITAPVTLTLSYTYNEPPAQAGQ